MKGIRVVKPLNCVPYIKEEAMQLLVDRFGWQRYAHKHYESRFTRFYEGYWLPTKFGYDKRRAHFSSLILTQQMTREEALRKIASPPTTTTRSRMISSTSRPSSTSAWTSLRELMRGPNKSYRDYKNSMPMIKLARRLLRLLGVQKAIIR